jgi:hypothetical protein
MMHSQVQLLAGRPILSLLGAGLLLAAIDSSRAAEAEDGVPPLPAQTRLAFVEDWSSGRIDPDRWYVLRKKWGDGNHGVVPENVRI